MIDIRATRDAVQRTAAAFSALLARATDADVSRAVRGTDWNVGEIAAHAERGEPVVAPVGQCGFG